jgi:hypothetical protein
LVAALTAQYIHRLVDAALDAREMLLFGDQKHYDDVRQLLPPPQLSSLHQPRSTRSVDDASSAQVSRKRGAVEVSNWDEPLPRPKIRGRAESSISTSVEHSDRRNGNDDQWVGVVGVDLWQNSRARAAYVQHRGISAQQFIFPLCHDSYVYGRIREIQATKVSVVDPILRDPIIWDIVRTEGQLQHQESVRNRRQVRQKSKQNKKSVQRQRNSDDDEDDQNESDSEEEEYATWPGLEKLLPANRTDIL